MSDAQSSVSEKEKGHASSINEKEISSSSVSSEIDPAFEKKTLLWVDFRIIPILALVYSFAVIDRINLGAAYTAGMGADLHLTVGARYSIVSCMTFVPYILLQLPGNILLRRLGARNWLAFIVFSWGIVELGMGFVHDWRMLTLCRVLLGALEASFFSSLVLIISTWYKRHEVQKRLAAFYLLASVASGFSPILAYCMSLLGGKRNIAGWRWIFIIEGAITIFLGIVTFLFIPTFPELNTFLTPKQTEMILKRIDDDRGDALPDPITFSKVMHHLKDWKLWVYCFMFLFGGLPSYAQSFFLPIILRGMGWSKTASLLLSAPPYAPAVVISMIVAYYSDKLKHRSSFIVGGIATCLVGLSMTAFAHSNSVRYAGAFLTTSGNLAATPTLLAYSLNNVVSQSKKSVTAAMTISFGGIAGIAATTIFRAQDAPKYVPGLSAAMGTQAVLLILLGILTVHFMRENSLVRSGKRAKPIQGQPGFLYTL